MRQITSCVLSLAFLMAGVASCAKTTKGKVTNEWNVTSFEQTDDYTSNQESLSNAKLSMSETSFTQESTTVTNGITTTYHSSGSVNAHVLEIKKDGTWNWTQDITYIYPNNTSNRLTVETGTWSFVGKTKGDDFKKNERILFNVLTKRVSTDYVSGQTVVTSDSTNETFETGENVRIYTITESKRKELQLELDSKVVSVDNTGDENTDTQAIKITLKAK